MIDLMDQFAGNADAQQQLGRSDVVGRGRGVPGLDQLGRNIQKPEGGTERNQEIEPPAMRACCSVEFT